MPRYSGYRRTGLNQSGNLAIPMRSKTHKKDYRLDESGVRRHDFLAGAPTVGTPLTLAGLDYLIQTFFSFERSFGAGSDDPPTPTAGNNYQSAKVFNGSRIRDHKSIIRLTNKSNTDPATLTVYKFELSFFDVLIWNTLIPANCPFTFTSTGTSELGDVDVKAVTAGALDRNSILNRKFLQHYAQNIGEITLGLEGSGKETAELIVTGVPPKCVRSQTGMYYGYGFANDSDKNEGRTLSLDYSAEISFVEEPSENRMPWLA